MKDSTCFDQPVFVLGLPRSGTSMVAGILHLSGCWKGTTFDGSPDNPEGFFEHVMLREAVNKPLLKSLGSDPLGVRRLPQLQDIPEVPPLHDAVRDILVSDGYDESKVWMFKDAKLTLTWPAWLHSFPVARWIIVLRDREEIINSCLKTGFMAQHSNDSSFWANWADEYCCRLKQLKQATSLIYEVNASDLVNGRLSGFERIVSSLDLKWDAESIKEFIQPRYWNRKKVQGR